MRAGRPSRDGRTAFSADSLYPQDGQHLPYFELNPAVRRTARAGRLPSGGPQRSQAHCEPPGARPAKTMLHSLVKAAKFNRRPKRSQEHNPFVLGAPPHAPLMRRPRRGRRFKEPRYSLSPQSSAQRGGKTVFGFPARRTIAAQSKALFSAPCQPHCGSACAPPRFRAPARFILFRLIAEIVESLL